MCTSAGSSVRTREYHARRDEPAVVGVVVSSIAPWASFVEDAPGVALRPDVA